MPEITDILLSRRSIRRFTDEPLDKETLVLQLKAAMAAQAQTEDRERKASSLIDDLHGSGFLQSPNPSIPYKSHLLSVICMTCLAGIGY